MSDKSREFLEQLKRILPKSPEWEAWLENKKELPPDFDSLPSFPEPPDPLMRYKDGNLVPIESLEEWMEYRKEIKALFHKWILGSVPPPPENLKAEIVNERYEDGALVREVELTFGPKGLAHIHFELLIPSGDGPFPVFMTQHNHRAWALIALRRGYIACIYSGADSKDDTDSFLKAYPEYDWSRLTRRAWASSRCIDYLYTLPQVDKRYIALTGHSRNGKQSLIAGALDERISLVISSSSGAGGSMPTRDYSEQHFGEGIELLTRVFPDWFHPRLRFFVGREHKLPVDFHELVALIAPRPCLLSIALNDPVESAWAIENTYLLAKRVYKLFNAEEKLRILWRHGSHETWATIIERYLDWCDLHFGRNRFEFPERLIYPHDWEEWKKNNVEKMDIEPVTLNSESISTLTEWEKKKKDIQEKVLWMLGEAPPSVKNPGGNYGREPEHIASLLKRSQIGEGIKKQQVVFGEYINGDIYMPQGLPESGHKAPVILWLHPFCFSHGYIPAYRRGEHKIFLPFVEAGFVVFCFDQIGFGYRIEEVENFYRRHPKWSLLGKMIRDSQSALDVLVSLPYVDTNRIFVVGYSLGAIIGLHLGVLDERIKGFAGVCIPEPFRLDKPDKWTGGIKKWSHRYMLIPRLGLFIRKEDKVPYDVDSLLACFAPKPVLVISPVLDREADVEDVTRSVEIARSIYTLYNATDKLQQMTPETYNQFGPEMQDLVIKWLKDIL